MSLHRAAKKREGKKYDRRIKRHDIYWNCRRIHSSCDLLFWLLKISIKPPSPAHHISFCWRRKKQNKIQEIAGESRKLGKMTRKMNEVWERWAEDDFKWILTHKQLLSDLVYSNSSRSIQSGVQSQTTNSADWQTHSGSTQTNKLETRIFISIWFDSTRLDCF